MDCKERLLTINRRKMSFVGHVLRHKDISCDLFLGSIYRRISRGEIILRTELELEVL